MSLFFTLSPTASEADDPNAPGGIALVQSASGTTADGSAGLTVPFGGCLVNATLYPYIGHYINGKPAFGNADEVFYDGDVWNCPLGAAIDATEKLLPWLADWSSLDPAPTVACSSPVTAGNSVIALITIEGPDGMNIQPTLVGGGGSLLSSVVEILEPSDLFLSAIFKKNNVTGGASGVTMSSSAAVRASMTILEVSGLADAAAFATNTASGTSASPTTGELDNTGHANSLIVGIIADIESDLASMTALTGLGVTGGGAIYQTAGYIITTVVDSYVGQSTTMADGNYAGAIAGFDPA